MFTYLAHASPLHRLNPTAKLLGLAVVAAGATLAFDPFIPGALALGLWLTAWGLGRIPWRQMLRRTVPLLLLPLPVALFTALYADLSPYPRPHILWQWGPWTLATEGIRVGIGLGLRVMTFVATSLLFVSTTDPTDFALSLIQNLKIPYRFGYGVLVAYRFLPLLRREYETIRMAHRVRGFAEGQGLRGLWHRTQRYAIPERTYYRTMRITVHDVLFVVALTLYTVLVYVLALRWGLADLQWIPQV